MNAWLIALPVAYLLGSIPFGYLLVRMLRKQDVRTGGSGNIGATNVARMGGKGLGVLTLLLDLGKGLLAVLLAKHLAPMNFDLAVLAAVSAVVGHVFPIWLGFRGGKGVATALGVFTALTPRASGAILLVFLLVVLITRYVSLASIVAAVSFPFFAFYSVHHLSAIAIAGFVFIPLLICVKHRGNIARLLAGTESRFGSKRAAA